MNKLILDRTQARLKRAERDLSLGFMKQAFRAEIERPWKKLEQVVEAWREVLPTQVAERTRLQGLDRGTLRVGVADSATLYELDRLLRSGAQRELLARVRGGAAVVRKIKLSVDVLASRHDATPEEDL
ncbi:DciA family protein [Mucisphaera sp.]|uniref:DciA family protein n=1 Tax=Mucisphaera sp. TaxID=2913024 RepID=UPI003D0B0F1B